MLAEGTGEGRDACAARRGATARAGCRSPAASRRSRTRRARHRRGSRSGPARTPATLHARTVVIRRHVSTGCVLHSSVGTVEVLLAVSRCVLLGRCRLLHLALRHQRAIGLGGSEALVTAMLSGKRALITVMSVWTWMCTEHSTRAGRVLGHRGRDREAVRCQWRGRLGRGAQPGWPGGARYALGT